MGCAVVVGMPVQPCAAGSDLLCSNPLRVQNSGVAMPFLEGVVEKADAIATLAPLSVPHHPHLFLSKAQERLWNTYVQVIELHRNDASKETQVVSSQPHHASASVSQDAAKGIVAGL